MPIPTREELKEYFETGDTPTQAQFAEFIDAVYDLAQQAQDAADAAAAAAAAVAGKTARCFGLVRVSNGGGGPGTATNLKNKDCTVSTTVTSIGSGGFGWRYEVVMTITPDADFPDDDFTVLPLIEGDNNSNLTVLGVSVTRAVDECVLTFQVVFTLNPQDRIIQFAIFD